MKGGFKVREMWEDTDDKYRKLDAIAVVLNRIRVAMLVFYIIMMIVGVVIGIVAVAFKGDSTAVQQGFSKKFGRH